MTYGYGHTSMKVSGKLTRKKKKKKKKKKPILMRVAFNFFYNKLKS